MIEFLIVALVAIVFVIATKNKSTSSTPSRLGQAWNSLRAKVPATGIIYVALAVALVYFWGNIEARAVSSAMLETLHITKDQAKEWLWVLPTLVMVTWGGEVFLSGFWRDVVRYTAGPALFILLVVVGLNYHYEWGKTKPEPVTYTDRGAPQGDWDDPSDGECLPYSYDPSHPLLIPEKPGRCLVLFVGVTREMAVRLPHKNDRLRLAFDKRTVAERPNFFRVSKPNELKAGHFIAKLTEQIPNGPNKSGRQWNLVFKSRDLLRVSPRDGQSYKSGHPILVWFWSAPAN